jgi:hypothetical protein
MTLIVTVTREFDAASPFHEKFMELCEEHGPENTSVMVAGWMRTDGADYFLGSEDAHATEPEWDFGMVEDG